MEKKKKIGELLIEAGYVTQDQVDEALEVQKTSDQRIGAILIDLGYLSEQSFLDFLSNISGVAGLDLASCEINQETLDLIPAQLARKLEVVPIGKLGNLLTLAMMCPIDDVGLNVLEGATGLRIRPVLCSRSAVHAAIERYYGKEDEQAYTELPKEDDVESVVEPIKLLDINKLVEDIDELPTLPAILSVISSIANDPKSSAADLAKVISSDASLSAKLLKVANSAAYGFSREISDIQHAVTMLGFLETQALALSVSVLEYLSDKTEHDFKEHWNHSLKCATLSRLIAVNQKAKGTDGAFVAGLLHDIGKIALRMSMREKQERVEELCSNNGHDRLAVEEEVFGLTHAEAGYLLGEHWLLPAPLTASIRYHHSLELLDGDEKLPAIVYLANTFCSIDLEELKLKDDFSDGTLAAIDMLGMSEAKLGNAIRLYTYMAPDLVMF